MTKDLVTLDSVKSRLAHFRNTRNSPKARFPEEIWVDISILCGRMSLSKVANSLDIPPERMARKIKDISIPSSIKKDISNGASKNVEVLEIGKIEPLFIPPITIEFELGTKSRVRVQCATSDIMAVSRLIKYLDGGEVC